MLWVMGFMCSSDDVARAVRETEHLQQGQRGKDSSWRVWKWRYLSDQQGASH